MATSRFIIRAFGFLLGVIATNSLLKLSGAAFKTFALLRRVEDRVTEIERIVTLSAVADEREREKHSR